MAPQASSAHAFNLPRIRETIKLPYTKSDLSPRHIFYDVKFYPYHTSSDVPPIFAAVGDRQTLLCRPSLEKGRSMSVVAALRDLETGSDGAVLNSCAWNFVDQTEPLISLGGPSGQIKVISALTGKIVTTLIGHGGFIQDLATHPLYPWILASASEDHSIRIWDLRRRIEEGENACLILCGHGQSHKEDILTVAWHSGGRYLLSGGLDHMICVWTLPNLAPDADTLDEEKQTDNSRSAAETKVIHYPHFVTSAVHSNYVDCVCFYGDLVMSKAAEEGKIVLWRITGFSSKLPPPGPDRAPKTAEFKDTRNGFMAPSFRPRNGKGNGSSMTDAEEHVEEPQRPLFERLLELQVPDSNPFYMRFSLLTPSPSYPDLHPVLAFGNHNSKIFFFDLTRLELGHDGRNSSSHDSTFAENGFLGPDDRRATKKGVARRLNSATSSNWPSHLTGRGGGSISSPGTGSPAPPSSPSSRRSSSIVTGVSSNPQDGGRANSTAATSLSASGVVAGPVEDRVKYKIDNPFEPVKAHHTVTVRSVYFTARQAAWSACGRWCVVVGETGNDALGVLCERWTS
jgi:polycomb protein EED